MAGDSARHVLIIGGGASGVLLAWQLLRDRSGNLHVTIIEKRPEVGRGVAYCTANSSHLLNVRASNMSALPDDPDHFCRWLDARKAGRSGVAGPHRSDPFSFVPRGIYGDYIASLIEPLRSDGERRLRVVQGECIWISQTTSGVRVVLADGCHLTAHQAVVATGHEPPPLRDGCFVDPWGPPCDADLPADIPVLILGTGLTMVDHVLALLLGGHDGPIVAMSRRGLLPRPHRRVEPLRIEAADVPFGAEFGTLFRWFRHLARAQMACGGDWRSVIDGIRPFTQQIWLRLSVASKRRFLEHARAWWDVHRHRMAPEADRHIGDAIHTGILTLVAGKVRAVEPNQQGALVQYRRRGEATERILQVSKIVDCTGIVKNPAHTTNPALRSLLDQGFARIDPLGIGIDVTAGCALIDQFGVPSERLFAIGPLSRAAFWEVIAIPDIRNQCAELAARLRGMDATLSEPNIVQRQVPLAANMTGSADRRKAPRRFD